MTDPANPTVSGIPEAQTLRGRRSGSGGPAQSTTERTLAPLSRSEALKHIGPPPRGDDTADARQRRPNRPGK